jgi:multiple sugar transport system substrate-binding protein
MKRFILVICILLIAGLSQVSAGGRTQRQQAGEKVIFWDTMTDIQGECIQRIVDAYNATNPAVQVERVTVVPTSTSDSSQLLTAVRAGTGPDVYYMNRPFATQRAADGALEDITSYLAQIDPNIADKYLDFAWKEVQYKGRTYGLPFDTDSRALFYNKAVLRDAGVDPAVLDPANGPITLAQFKEIAFKVNQKDAQGRYSRVGFIPTYAQGWLFTWGFVFGGSFVDINSTRITATDSKIVSALTWMKDWFRDMGPTDVQDFLSTYEPPNNPPQQSPFYSGRIAMQITGDWELASIQQYAPNMDYGYTYIPVPNRGDTSTTWAAGFSMVVPRGSRRIEAAARFIAYACGAEGQKRYTVETTHLPTYKSVMDDSGNFDTSHQFFRTLMNSTGSIATSLPSQVPVNVQLWDAMAQAQYEATIEQKDPLTALQEAQNRVQADYNQYR